MLMAGTWSAGAGRARRDERREAIIEGALRLFAERGALPVRVEDIAAEVGISRATFYKYFAERDEILAELFRRLLATAPPEAGGDGPVAGRIAALLAGTAARMVEHEQLARFVYTLPLRHDALLAEQAVRPAFIVAVDALVAEGVAAGELREDLPQAMLTGHLARAFEQAVRDWAAGHTDDPAGHTAAFADLTLAGCQAAAPARPSARGGAETMQPAAPRHQGGVLDRGCREARCR
jgi:AcrR family transcriptional regulator